MHAPTPVAFDSTTYTHPSLRITDPLYVEESGQQMPDNPDGTTPVDESVSFNQIYADMEDLLKTGKVKAIGVSNFSPKTCATYLPLTPRLTAI